jgi:hypothetical protein
MEQELKQALDELDPNPAKRAKNENYIAAFQLRKHHPIFQKLAIQTIQELIHQVYLLNLQKNDLLYREGEK